MFDISIKFYLYDLKTKAFDSWNIVKEEQMNYVLCNEKFEVWPPDVQIIDEIHQLNIDRGFANHSAKFYNLNFNVTVTYILNLH